MNIVKQMVKLQIYKHFLLLQRHTPGKKASEIINSVMVMLMTDLLENKLMIFTIRRFLIYGMP